MEDRQGGKLFHYKWNVRGPGCVLMMEPMATLTELPEAFAAGTTVKYSRTLPDYPANAGWTLRLLLAGANVLAVTATPNGADYLITITAEQSGTLAAGTYKCAEEVSKAGETYIVASGTVIVEPNLAAALAGQHQSKNERLLELVDTLLAGRVVKDLEAYGIDGMTVSKIPFLELAGYRASLAAAVARENKIAQVAREAGQKGAAEAIAAGFAVTTLGAKRVESDRHAYAA